MANNTPNKKDLKAIYDFMAKMYMGNWQYRWIGTPHMSRALKQNQKESILAHELACIGLWFNLRRICPNLNKLVNSEKIYEMLWAHDLGEIYVGDISQTRQVNGEGKHKHIQERKEIIKMAGKIPKNTLDILLQYFDAFEGKIEKMNDLEIIICKWLDNVQGHHFGLIFGNDHKKHSVLINKILNRSYVTRSKRLLQILKARKHKKAYKEVEFLIKNFIETFEASGIKLELDEIIP
jgi:5'-deoxynucleotidase YfbR-like HD superfamily hydrolase